jgi:hypothetical protein
MNVEHIPQWPKFYMQLLEGIFNLPLHGFVILLTTWCILSWKFQSANIVTLYQSSILGYKDVNSYALLSTLSLNRLDLSCGP